jgi:1-acyl-sn-glycerol-3-phosphate acyltransferase
VAVDASHHPQGLVGRPSRRATVSYRLLLGGARLIGRGVFGFRTVTHGLDRLPLGPDGLPAGGWIAAGFPHRTWVEPFILADVLPREPRLVFFGDGRAIYRSALRRWLVHRIGGVIPIWPGGGREAVETYLGAASRALAAGTVLCIFPEIGPPTKPGIARPFGMGLAYFALRTGAPIVPIVFGGTDELYRGRRFHLTVLDPVTWQELVGAPPGAPPPEAWSSAERRAARRLTQELHERAAPAVVAAQVASTPRGRIRKRWRWLTTAWH